MPEINEVLWGAFAFFVLFGLIAWKGYPAIKSAISGEVQPTGLPFDVVLKTVDVANDGSLVVVPQSVTFHAAANGFGLVKPPAWTRPRRAPGEIQMAHSELLQATAGFRRRAPPPR